MSDPDSYYRQVVKNEDSGGFHFSGYLPDLRKGDTEGPDMICWGIATVCSGVEGLFLPLCLEHLANEILL